MGSLFHKPSATDPKRLKMLVYGPTGVGKTITALHMPNVRIIDMEDGAKWYMDKFPDAQILQTTNVDSVYDAVDELIRDPGEAKTFVLDTISKFWELLQEKHVKRLRVKKGMPAYTLQPSDYKVIKSDFKALINKLLALDLNIVATATVKSVYSIGEGEFMKIIGTEPDVHKDAPHMFDTVLELKFGPDDTRIAKTLKDRTNTLPKEFEFSYQKLVEYFGLKDLEREPVQFRTQLALNKATNRTTEIKFDGKSVFTAGVSAETLAKLKEIIEHTQMDENELRSRLLDDYSVGSLLDLKEDEARLLLNELSAENNQ